MHRTALHDKHIDLGAKMVDFAGFEMPVMYSSIKEEHLAVRRHVGLFDVSHMGEFVVRGPQAADLLQWVCSNDIRRMQPLQVQYNCLPNDEGGIVDDLLVYKWADDEFNLVVNAVNIAKDLAWIERWIDEKGFEAAVEDISDRLSLIALQGPAAQDVLAPLTDADLNGLAYYRFTAGTVAGVEDVVISNTGYTGSGGYELYVWNHDAGALWDALMDAGADHGLRPCGLAARDTLRLEAGFCLYGNDIDETTSPIEAGLGWITKFKEPFVHSEHHKTLKEEGPESRLVGIEITDRGIARTGHAIEDEDGREIGRVTSGTKSPLTGKSIGLGYVDAGHAATGTPLRIAVRDKRLVATVVSLPFFNKTNVW